MKKPKVLIGCDLHNTLLFSNKAWISAFLSFDTSIDEKELSKLIYKKKSRKKLAIKYNIDYDKLLEKYYSFGFLNKTLIDFIISLKETGYPIVLISSSNKEKVSRDLTLIDENIIFDKIYSKENFNKKDPNDWEKIINKYRVNLMIYIGNDYDEDIIKNDKVVSLLSGHFFEELKENRLLKGRNK